MAALKTVTRHAVTAEADEIVSALAAKGAEVRADKRFGEKVFVGKNIGDRWRAELFTLHFSNGDFTELNSGFNYLGLGVHYNF